MLVAGGGGKWDPLGLVPFFLDVFFLIPAKLVVNFHVPLWILEHGRVISSKLYRYNWTDWGELASVPHL